MPKQRITREMVVDTGGGGKHIMDVVIRKIVQEEMPQALSLVWRVFQAYEAPDYTQEGVDEFYKSIHDADYLSNLYMYGAFERDELLGVIATRNGGTHIALFFVDGSHHRQGIGKQLFQTVLKECPSGKMTVNSSPCAVPVYHKLGFVDTGEEQVVNGLRFTPMERIGIVYELKDTSKVKALFAGWQETLIYSCLQNVMGKIYVTDPANPVSAFAFVGCFGFFAGVPDRDLVINKPDGFVIMVPQNEEWSALIEECYPSAKRVIRYAIKKDTIFDVEMLRREISRLPSEYELKQIDAVIYDQCLGNPVTADFVSAFENKEQYLKMGRGMVIIKDGKIVSGASSYARYDQGIEIEVDTVESERRKHLATIVCSALILECLDEGLYPSWDAQNMHSVHLAEKLGYEFDHEYAAYEVGAEARTH